MAGITVLPARSTRTARGGGVSSPCRPTLTNAPFSTTNAERSTTVVSPTISWRLQEERSGRGARLPVKRRRADRGGDDPAGRRLRFFSHLESI
jgi:hypothetical protein